MKTTFLHRLHVGILALASFWALVCLAAPPVKDDTAIYTAIAVGPLVSYAIAAWLIGQLRRDFTQSH